MGRLAVLISFSFLSILVETKVTPLIKQTGKDLLLEVKEIVTLSDSDLLFWTLNGSKEIARLDDSGKTKIFRDFLGKAEIFPQNQSLLLRNLTKSDSGDYRARVFGDNPKVIADYKITVLDPVSPVNLTVTNCSSVYSNLTVSCSTQDSLISRTFTCVDQTCSEERGNRAEFTTPAASLKVYLKKDSVICVHSNQVSRTEDIRKIEDFCEKDPVPEPIHHKIDVLRIVLPVIGVALLLLILGGVACYSRRRRKYKTQSMENTVYEVPQAPNQDLLLQQRQMNDTVSTDLPPTIYHLLGHPIEPEVKTLPESVYATVQKTPKT